MPTPFDPSSKQEGIKYFLEDGTDPRLVVKDPDCLVELATDVIGAILRHPQPHERQVLGTRVYVVDDAAYEAIFYFFSGKTRTQMFKDSGDTAALFLGKQMQPVISERLFKDALERERGY